MDNFKGCILSPQKCAKIPALNGMNKYCSNLKAQIVKTNGKVKVCDQPRCLIALMNAKHVDKIKARYGSLTYKEYEPNNNKHSAKKRDGVECVSRSGKSDPAKQIKNTEIIVSGV